VQGINFDPELPVTLRIELAKSNSKTKRRRGTLALTRSHSLYDLASHAGALLLFALASSLSA